MKEKELIKIATETLTKLEVNGYPINIVWKAPAFGRMRWDIFGIFDLIVFNRISERFTFIQITTLPNVSARRKKMKKFFEITQCHIPNSIIWGWSEQNQAFRSETI